MTEIIDRQTAIALGLKRYFTGKPCRRGHIAERSTRRMHCLECERLRARKRNRTQRSEYSRRYRSAYPEKVREIQRQATRRYNLAHPEKRLEQQYREQRYRSAYPERRRERERRRNERMQLALRVLTELGITF